MTDSAMPIVAILGDSRAFDTYYTNDSYRERYGYNATFPHLLAMMAIKAAPSYEPIHIPDHFRGGTIENNIIRLALADPAIVVLCDGIWETLVNKDWVIDGRKLDLRQNSRLLADHFIAGSFATSPQGYAVKQRRLISYFRRRRRQCIWMSLPTTPREHLGGLHFAGNLQCIPEWRECLQAVNEAMATVVSAYGALWLDLDGLVSSVGGFEKALIDQWHFSQVFHLRVAEALASTIAGQAKTLALEKDHISHQFMLARRLGPEPVALVGPEALISQWTQSNPDADVSAAVSPSDSDGIFKIAASATQCVMALDGFQCSVSDEAALLRSLSPDQILLYPNEVGPIVNPVGADKVQHSVLK